jgi:hypothetical protein
VAFSKDAEARATYAAQAGVLRTPRGQAPAEWQARGADDVARCIGHFGYEPLPAPLYASLGDLVASGVVRRDEAAAMAIPTVGCSAADLRAPFVDGDRFHVLRLEQLEIFDAEDHIWSAFEVDQNAHAFAERWTAFSRGSVFPHSGRGSAARTPTRAAGRSP